MDTSVTGDTAVLTLHRVAEAVPAEWTGSGW